jgi:hypothetical protein
MNVAIVLAGAIAASGYRVVKRHMGCGETPSDATMNSVAANFIVHKRVGRVKRKGNEDMCFPSRRRALGI